MSTAYLFQIDGAENNNAFFGALFQTLNPTTTWFYKGLGFRVGDWIPDGARVDVEESQCSLTLIELEETRPEARKSCRKYLPESSDLILQGLDEYLERVIRARQSTGDPREQGFSNLRTTLSNRARFTVRTACELRAGTEIVEDLALIDQVKSVTAQRAFPDRNVRESMERDRSFRGTLRLNADDVKALGRCILVLDCVIGHQDHSNATFHSWRNKAPLKRSLKGTNESPILRKLLVETKSGATLDFEGLLAELAGRWGDHDARSLVANYFSSALQIRAHETMNRVFQEARKCISANDAELAIR